MATVVGNPGNGAISPAAKQPGVGAPSAGSLQGSLTQALLALAQNPGTLVGGSAGGMVSNAPARAAEQAAYNQSSANDNAVFDQATANVNAQAPVIGQGYDTAASNILNNATARQASDAGATQSQQNNMAAEAARLGLNFIPTTQGLAGQTANALGSQYKTNADAWNGLLQSQKQTALAGNTRTANAFQYSKTQAQTALSSLLASALSKLPDKYVAGKAGKVVGATSPAAAASIYEHLFGYSNTGQAQALSSAKAASAARGTNTTSTKTSGGKTTTTVTAKRPG